MVLGGFSSDVTQLATEQTNYLHLTCTLVRVDGQAQAQLQAHHQAQTALRPVHRHPAPALQPPPERRLASAADIILPARQQRLLPTSKSPLHSSRASSHHLSPSPTLTQCQIGGSAPSVPFQGGVARGGVPSVHPLSSLSGRFPPGQSPRISGAVRTKIAVRLRTR